MKTAARQSNGRVFINGVILTWLRQQAGMSIRQLADQAEIAPSTISRIERSKQLANRRTLRAIAKALGTREEVLIWR